MWMSLGEKSTVHQRLFEWFRNRSQGLGHRSLTHRDAPRPSSYWSKNYRGRMIGYQWSWWEGTRREKNYWASFSCNRLYQEVLRSLVIECWLYTCKHCSAWRTHILVMIGNVKSQAYYSLHHPKICVSSLKISIFNLFLLICDIPSGVTRQKPWMFFNTSHADFFSWVCFYRNNPPPPPAPGKNDHCFLKYYVLFFFVYYYGSWQISEKNSSLISF